MKNIQILSFAVLTLLASCRQEKSEKNPPSIVESYSPGYVITGDTVSVIGQFLDGASVFVGDTEVSLVKNTSNELQFLATEDLIDNPITVSSSSISHTFSTDLIVNHEITVEDKLSWLESSSQSVGELLRGPKQLLITDFDGAGIRIADATNRFDETQWESQVQSTGTELISNNYLGISSDLGKGNFYALSLSDLSHLDGPFGHVGALNTRLDLLNGNSDYWIDNFSEYTGEIISEPNESNLKDLYLNFAYFKNGNFKSYLQVDLRNASLSDIESYRNKVSLNDAVTDWEWISIPFSQFKNNWGAGTNVVEDNLYSQINQIKFNFSHYDKRNGTGVAEGEMLFMIDHIILTQGAPYFGQP